MNIFDTDFINQEIAKTTKILSKRDIQTKSQNQREDYAHKHNLFIVPKQSYLNNISDLFYNKEYNSLTIPEKKDLLKIYNLAMQRFNPHSLFPDKLSISQDYIRQSLGTNAFRNSERKTELFNKCFTRVYKGNSINNVSSAYIKNEKVFNVLKRTRAKHVTEKQFDLYIKNAEPKKKVNLKKSKSLNKIRKQATFVFPKHYNHNNPDVSRTLFANIDQRYFKQLPEQIQELFDYDTKTEQLTLDYTNQTFGRYNNPINNIKKEHRNTLLQGYTSYDINSSASSFALKTFDAIATEQIKKFYEAVGNNSELKRRKVQYFYLANYVKNKQALRDKIDTETGIKGLGKQFINAAMNGSTFNSFMYSENLTSGLDKKEKKNIMKLLKANKDLVGLLNDIEKGIDNYIKHINPSCKKSQVMSLIYHKDESSLLFSIAEELNQKGISAVVLYDAIYIKETESNKIEIETTIKNKLALVNSKSIKAKKKDEFIIIDTIITLDKEIIEIQIKINSKKSSKKKPELVYNIIIISLALNFFGRGFSNSNVGTHFLLEPDKNLYFSISKLET